MRNYVWFSLFEPGWWELCHTIKPGSFKTTNDSISHVVVLLETIQPMELEIDLGWEMGATSNTNFL